MKSIGHIYIGMIYILTVINQIVSVLTDSVNVLKMGDVPQRKRRKRKDCLDHSSKRAICDQKQYNYHY